MPRNQYGTSQYRLTNPPDEPVPHPRNPYDSPQYRYPHPWALAGRARGLSDLQRVDHVPSNA